MKTSTAALAVLFVAVLCYQVSSSPASVNIPDLCCLQFSTKALPLSRVVMYELTSNRCAQPAVIFTTIRNNRVCGKLHDKWVQDIVSPRQEKAGSG